MDSRALWRASSIVKTRGAGGGVAIDAIMRPPCLRARSRATDRATGVNPAPEASRRLLPSHSADVFEGRSMHESIRCSMMSRNCPSMIGLGDTLWPAEDCKRVLRFFMPGLRESRARRQIGSDVAYRFGLILGPRC